jgi:hypothetical protein
MPIRAEFRHLYGRQWLTVTRPRVLERRRPALRALPQTAARLDLHLHLEDARPAILRHLAVPHDLD